MHGIVKAIGDPAFTDYKTAKPAMVSMVMSNVGGTNNIMEEGDTITITFSEPMNHLGTEYFIEVKHTGSRVIKIYKGNAAIPTNPIADLTTANFAASGASLPFTGTDMDAWEIGFLVIP